MGRFFFFAGNAVAAASMVAAAFGLRFPPGKPSTTPDRRFFLLGCGFALLAVALGAFGAHGLKPHLSSDQLALFEVGVRYHMYHALALLATAWAYRRWPVGLARASGWCFATGILLFSGSLYTLSLTSYRWLGILTPVGGIAFIAGWAGLIVLAWRSPS